jgi:hypothetical protein
MGQHLARAFEATHAEQVGKEITPAVEKRRRWFHGDTLCTGHHQRVDHLLALSRIGILDKFADFVGAGNRPVRSRETRRRNSASEQSPACGM